MNLSLVRSKESPEELKPETKVSSRQIPAWAPLRTPVFRAIWLAALASNLGTWMQEVGVSWLMTSLTTRADMVALVQTAATIPVFFLVLPAGALADVVDRRKLMIGAQVWMMLVAGALGVMTFMHMVGPWTLLGFTFLMALGGAISMPAWQGIIPETVKRAELSQAVQLGGISFNLSRIVGPALGGVIIAIAAHYVGRPSAPAIVFLLNALSFSGIVLVLVRWRRPERVSDMPPEHVTGAMRAGARYVRHAPELRAILIRLGSFTFFGASMWSLMPLFARQNLGLSAAGYGGLLGFLGAGAVVGGLLGNRLRAHFSSEVIVTGATVGAVSHLFILSLIHDINLVRIAMFLAGLWWTWSMMTLNISMLRVAPEWVRARASATYVMVQFGAQAAGAILWGFFAQNTSIPQAFAVTACGMALSLVLLRRFEVVESGLNLKPSAHWPEPILEFEPTPEDGPVLVMVEYEVEPENTTPFIEAMQPVRRIRLRDGALRWNLWQDASQPTRWVESMLVESWNEHLRQHGRATHADREIEAIAQSFHQGDEAPRITHLIAASARARAED